MTQCYSTTKMSTQDNGGMANPAFHTAVADVPRSGHSRHSSGSDLSIDSSEGSRRSSRMDTFVNYITSQKGRELCMGTSLMVAVILIVIGVTLLFSLHLASDGQYMDISLFMLVMFVLSSVSMLLMIVLGHIGQLTNDDHYKDQRRTAFLRGGMTVLATGSIVYYSLELALDVRHFHECRQAIELTKHIVSIFFTILQVTFLLRFSKVRINQNLVIVTACRFMLMVIIASNVATWLCVLMDETMIELEHATHSHTGDSDVTTATSVFQTDSLDPSISSWKQDPDCHHSLDHNVSLFIFPFLIEFCVVASTMILAIWEKCGVGLEHMRGLDTEGGRRCSSSMESIAPKHLFSSGSVEEVSSNGAEEPVDRSGFFNSNAGFVCGWLCLLISIAGVTLVFLDYVIDHERRVAYALNLFLVLCGIITTPFAMYKMSRMRFKDEQIRRQRKGERSLVKKSRLHRKMDRNLLTVTFLALLTYKMMSIPVALNTDNVVILVDAFASIFYGFLQTLFLNWYACHKRAKTPRERVEKPGRQFLEFLRMLNLSLWLVNTFLLKDTHAKDLHQETYGIEAWVILSNILQPLTILYYFHSMVCIAEVIIRSYTNKYVGIPRPKKTDCDYYEKKRPSVVSFMDSHKVLTYTRSASLSDLPTPYDQAIMTGL